MLMMMFETTALSIIHSISLESFFTEKRVIRNNFR